jgi:hypothetical protein
MLGGVSRWDMGNSKGLGPPPIIAPALTERKTRDFYRAQL